MSTPDTDIRSLSRPTHKPTFRTWPPKNCHRPQQSTTKSHYTIRGNEVSRKEADA
jgi:hypothetical protein